MNETMTQPAQAGREKCKAFCGLTIEAIKSYSVADSAWRDAPMEPELWQNYRRYCTAACRDARLPPISPPAPAPARERRAGQRWQCILDDRVYVGTLLNCDQGHWKVAIEGAGFEHWSESRWTYCGFTMTLLSDAPATSEPGRACSTCSRPMGNIDGWTFTASIDGPITSALCPECRVAEKAAASPPAQEAAKAEPKCGNSGCQTPYQNVAQRWCASYDGNVKLPAELEWSCEPCHMLDEEEFAEKMMFEATGAPYAGPSRLPRPRLTHSAMWADWAEDTQ